ncbi:hypothetical protein [Neorhizobium sp. DAR64872/K0K18]|uniref:hypothetical protein n=1 Tax=Neorhizobium sp. DAR64872/K0K18 TaxID=3421958 RepID=UPI003D28BE84
MSVIYARKRAKIVNRMKAGLGFLDHTTTNNQGGIQQPEENVSRGLKVATIDPTTPTHVKFWNPPVQGPDKRTTTRKSRKVRDDGKHNKSSKATARGFTIFNGVIVQHESELERRFSQSVQARNDVEFVFSQFPRLGWEDDDRTLHHHTADYYVKYRSGLKRAFVVKLERKRAEMEDLIKRIEAYGLDGKVDDIRLVTELYATHERAENARWLLWSRDKHDEMDVAALLSIVEKMQGWFRFGDLLRGSNDPRARRVAIWRLIDSGTLFPPTDEKITEVTWLRRATN